MDDLFFLAIILFGISAAYLLYIILINHRGYLPLAVVYNFFAFHYITYIVEEYFGEISWYKNLILISSRNQAFAVLVSGVCIFMVVLGYAIFTTKKKNVPIIASKPDNKNSNTNDIDREPGDRIFEILMYIGAAYVTSVWMGIVPVEGVYHTVTFSGELSYTSSALVEYMGRPMVVFGFYRLTRKLAEYKPKLALVFLAALIIILTMTFNQRRFGIGFGLAIGTLLVLRNKLSWKGVVWLAIPAVVVFLLMPVYRATGRGFIDHSLSDRMNKYRDIVDVSQNRAVYLINKNIAGRFDSNSFLLNIDEVGTSKGYYLFFDMVKLVFLSSIPSAIWPSKIDILPVTDLQGLILYSFPEMPYIDYIPSVPAELWAAGGWVAAIIGSLMIGYILAHIELWGISKESVVSDLALVSTLFLFISSDVELHAAIIFARTILGLMVIRRIIIILAGARVITKPHKIYSRRNSARDIPPKSIS